MKTLYELLAHTNLHIESIYENCAVCKKQVPINEYVKSYAHCNCEESQTEMLYSIEGFDKLMTYNEAVQTLEYFIKVNRD